MAEREYRRLCSVGTCGGEHKAQGYCLRHYRQWQRNGVRDDPNACAHCQAAFVPSQSNAMYCSKRCKLAAWKARNPERFEELNARRVSAYYAKHCAHCGEAFGSKRDRAHCSDKCDSAAWYAAHPVSMLPDEKQCKGCGGTYKPPFRQGRPTEYCSAKCSEQAQRAVMRVSRIRRKAATRAVTVESVDPLKVFARDRWRCQLCGIKTPKAKRGTYADDAPELDHITPLAKGGEHSYRNTQCSCRKCNGLKSDKPLGQMLLIG